LDFGKVDVPAVQINFEVMNDQSGIMVWENVIYFLTQPIGIAHLKSPTAIFWGSFKWFTLF
jgi:hypothetical protein